MSEQPDADAIRRLGFGFRGSQALLSALELGLFTALADGPLDAERLRQRLGLHARGTSSTRWSRSVCR